jgi:hypothetical protein
VARWAESPELVNRIFYMWSVQPYLREDDRFLHQSIDRIRTLLEASAAIGVS